MSAELVSLGISRGRMRVCVKLPGRSATHFWLVHRPQPGEDGVCNAIPIWLPGDAKLAAKELAANPLGGELFERNSHRGCKLRRWEKLAAK